MKSRRLRSLTRSHPFAKKRKGSAMNATAGGNAQQRIARHLGFPGGTSSAMPAD
jgi:hypothetical protein